MWAEIMDIYQSLSATATVLLAALATVLAALLIWLFTAGRIFTVTLVNWLLRYMFEQQALKKVSETERLWALSVPRSLSGFQDFAAEVLHRQNTYDERFLGFKLPFHGYFAVTMRLAKQMHPEFEDHLRAQKETYARFTAIAATYHATWRQCEAAIKAAECKGGGDTNLRQTLNTIEARRTALLSRRRRLSARWYQPVSWSVRYQCRWWVLSLCLRHLKHQRKQAIQACKKLAQANFRRYEVKLIRLAQQLIHLDEQHLRVGLHGLAAHARSLESTVISGQLFNLLAEKDTEASKQLRSMLKLPDDFPTGIEEVRRYMVEWLRDPKKSRAVALSNTPAREDVLEWFLRYWLYEHIEVSFLDNAYLEDLPAPAASGLANQAYGYPGNVWPPKAQVRKAPKAKPAA